MQNALCQHTVQYCIQTLYLIKYSLYQHTEYSIVYQHKKSRLQPHSEYRLRHEPHTSPLEDSVCSEEYEINSPSS